MIPNGSILNPSEARYSSLCLYDGVLLRRYLKCKRFEEALHLKLLALFPAYLFKKNALVSGMLVDDI